MSRLATARTLALLLAAAGGLFAQEPGARRSSRKAPLFPVEANIVWIDVVAADASDRPVNDLGMEELEVYEAGERRAIVLFVAPESRPAGRAIAFLIDDVSAGAREVRQARDLVKRTLEKAVAGDRVLLRARASGVAASLTLPAGRAELERQLSRVREHPDLAAALGDPDQARRLHWGRVEAAAEALRALEAHPGPRVLVMLGRPLPYGTDGPFGRAAYERLMRASERAAAPVYYFRLGDEAKPLPGLTRAPDWVTGTGSVIGVAPLLPMPPGGSSRDGSTLLDAAAADSGGFTAADPAGWSWALARILAPRAYYLLGIPSEPDTWDGAYHPVELRVLRKGVRLLARKGYFAPPPAAAAPR